MQDDARSAAIGIDLGGTKIETRLFDRNWRMIASLRVATPDDYAALVDTLAAQIAWAAQEAGMTDLPVGIGAAGLVNPASGLVLAANLAASGQPLPADIAARAGRPVTYLNDCHALALSESVFGAGQGHARVAALVLGTGVGGGLAVDGAVVTGAGGLAGEFGHSSAPLHLLVDDGLPVVDCGCGGRGCIENYIAGAGLSRLAKTLTGKVLTPAQIAARKADDMARPWRLWCDLVADLLRTLTLTVGPDIVVIGGGLSRIDGVLDDLTAALARARIGDFAMPRLALAEGGDASGARGAAYAALQAAQQESRNA